MFFLYPSFLCARFALLVPIIIHLFNFKKYKIVYFTNVRFLKDLQEKSKAKSRLKEWLILLIRCLAIVCLVLAFAQPFVTGEKNASAATSNKILSIYIDNSFSTQNVNKQGAVLDIEKIKAKELIQSMSNADKVQIITNDFEGKHQRLHTKQDALTVVEEIKISPSVRSIDLVLKRQAEFLRQFSADNKQIFLFSDLQKSSFNIAQSKIDTAYKVFVLPVIPNLQNNIYLDSCWFESPMQQIGFNQHLHARVINAGSQAMDVLSAKLYINKLQVAMSSFSIEPNGIADLNFNFTCKQAGFNFCEIKIDDYPITFDDQLRFTFNSTKRIQIDLINGKGKQDKLSALFKNDSLFDFKQNNEMGIDYALFKSADVIVLNQLSEFGSGFTAELLSFTKKGGSIVMIPSLTSNLTSYFNLYDALHLPKIQALDTTGLKTNEIDQNNGFFNGVFENKVERMNLPQIKQHYQLALLPGMESIMTLQNGDVLLGSTKFNKANLYFFSTALSPEAGNFYNHALLVPSIYKMCFNSVQTTPLYFTLGGQSMFEIPSNPLFIDTPPSLVNTETKNDFIPEYKMYLNNIRFYFQHQPQQPGFYFLQHQKQNLQALAFNYSRFESDLSTYTMAELQQILDQNHLDHFKLIDYQSTKAGDLVSLVEGGKKLWKLFLLLALSFILAEVVLLRFLKQ
ncbi:MAG: BatA domain-containing protein [Bacteroidota bacterium]